MSKFHDRSIPLIKILFLLLIMDLLSVSALPLQILPQSASTPSWGGWRIALNIGREPFTTMPSTWATSGARFPLVMKCNFTDDGIVSSISGNVKFTGREGEITTPIESGTWALKNNNRDLSFALTLTDRIERNGVELGPCTLLCEGLLYSTKDLDAMNQEYYKERRKTDNANSKVKEMKQRREAPKKWNFETNQWEQRYDKESGLSNVVKRLKLILAQQSELVQSRKRPEPKTLSLERGSFSGVDCDVYIKKMGTIKMKGMFNNGVIGTWAAEPINDNPASYYRPSF